MVVNIYFHNDSYWHQHGLPSRNSPVCYGKWPEKKTFDDLPTEHRLDRPEQTVKLPKGNPY